MTPIDLLWQDECARHRADADACGALVYADKDEAPLRRHLNAVSPMSFACVGARVVVSCYPSVRSVILPHMEKYCFVNTLFSDEAFASLDRALRPYLAAWGYRPAAFPSRYGISLVQGCADDVPTSPMLDGTVRVTDAMLDWNNHTSMRTSDCAVRGAFAHVVNGEIVCMASVNRVSGAERCVEIGVECAPDHRRRGYATSCVCALTRALCGEGQVVLYRHYHNNLGSAAVARAAGFVPVGRFFSYTSFAI